MDEESLPPVCLRAIIEMSFLDADRLDPTDYDRLMEQWRKAMEDSPIFNCRDVGIIEFLTIGRSEDEGYARIMRSAPPRPVARSTGNSYNGWKSEEAGEGRP